jgi:hypothetical protein
MNPDSLPNPKNLKRLPLKDEKQHRLYGRLLKLPPGEHLQKLLDSLRKK